MFRYVDHRFHSCGFSFQIPNGFYYDSEPDEERDNFMKFWSPDETYALILQVNKDGKGSETELASVIKELEPTILQPVSPVSVNGLSGHHAMYSQGTMNYYEAWFDGGEGIALTLVIEGIGNIQDAAVVTVNAVDPRPENI